MVMVTRCIHHPSTTLIMYANADLRKHFKTNGLALMNCLTRLTRLFFFFISFFICSLFFLISICVYKSFDKIVNHQFLKAGRKFVYRTPTQKQMFSLLCNMADELSTGAFVGMSGLSSTVYTGKEYNGKSFSLHTFCTIACGMWPDIIPIYLNFGDYENPQCALRSSTILDVVATVLSKHKIYIPQNYNGNYITNALLFARKRVLLLVDEFDGFYNKGYVERNPELFDASFRGGGCDPVKEEAYRVLLNLMMQDRKHIADLKFLDSQQTGCFALVVCG